MIIKKGDLFGAAFFDVRIILELEIEHLNSQY